MGFFRLSNGEEIFYEDTGKGSQTIVMLHGWTSSHKVYAPVVPAISEKARCITYDHRGHGLSKSANHDHVTVETLADDLQELILGLELHDIILLGWSLGAATVMEYVSKYGCGALREVVLCDMSPKQLNDEEWKLGLYQGNYTKENMDNDAGKDFYTLYKAFARGAIPRLAKVPDIMLFLPLKERLAECDEGVMRSLSVSLKGRDYRPVVEKITVPLHYFYAVPGSLYSPKLEGWYRENVRSQFSSAAFEDSTHMLITDHPDLFAQEVIKVIEECE